MLKATKKALERSIKKWERIVADEGVYRGSQKCALCKRFLNKDTKDFCPLHKSGKCWGGCCEEWFVWSYHVADEHFDGCHYVHDGCETCKTLAQAVLDRLKKELV